MVRCANGGEAPPSAPCAVTPRFGGPVRTATRRGFARRFPVRLVHGIAAALFALLGLATLLGAGESFGL